jgi:hypothetical protein
MRALLAIINFLSAGSSIGEGEEHLHVQALVAQLAVERFDIAVLDRLARADEVQMNTVLVGPVIQRLAGELAPVVDRDRLRRTAQGDDLIESGATFSPLSVLSRRGSGTLA